MLDVLTEVRLGASNKSFYRDDNATERGLNYEHNSGYTCNGYIGRRRTTMF